MAVSTEVEYTVQGKACRVADLGSKVAVIVTHPWGPLGGNLHNNVVVAAVLYFQRLGCTTCRFDFCGTQIGFGNAQVAQLQEIATKLLNGDFCASGSTNTTTNPPPKSILLVGYSYGSLITTSASATISPCLASIAISPPFGVAMWLLLFSSSSHWQAAAAAAPDLPRLFVLGDQDNFTSEASLRSTVHQYFTKSKKNNNNNSHDDNHNTIAIVQGADHFWVRRERDALGVVGQWLTHNIKALHGELLNLPHLEFGLNTTKKLATKFHPAVGGNSSS